MTARSDQWEKRSAERPPLRPQRPGEDAGVGPRAGDRMIDRRLLQPGAREAGRAGFPGGGKGRGKGKGRGGMAGGARPGQSRRGERSGAAGTAGPALGAHPRCCSREHRRRAVGPGVAAALPSASSFHFPSAPDFLLFCFFFLPTLSALCLPSVSAWARLFEERRFPVRVFPSSQPVLRARAGMLILAGFRASGCSLALGKLSRDSRRSQSHGCVRCSRVQDRAPCSEARLALCHVHVQFPLPLGSC